MYSIITNGTDHDCSVYCDGLHVFNGSYAACIAYLDMFTAS